MRQGRPRRQYDFLIPETLGDAYLLWVRVLAISLLRIQGTSTRRQPVALWQNRGT